MAIKPEFELASAQTRLANYIIDNVLRAVTAAALLVVGDVLGFLSFYDSFRQSGINQYLVGLLWAFVYYVFFEGIYGQSPAKMITGCAVVTAEEGKRPDLNTIMLRTLCRFIPLNAFSFLGYDPVGWHDSLSKTRVVIKKGMP
jgi:uncharacterized RDD family membrane protein YckC